ncbi:MAG: transcription-repair coupling factor [Magnetococcales bacterium]|nr:transcription-repair coupling factor [Magnetococcales bacterium]NGZ25980.1 transcription-repair coupling factor [Magnetococcales bacterium]
MDDAKIRQHIIAPLLPLVQGKSAIALSASGVSGGGIGWLASILAGHLQATVVVVSGKTQRSEALYRELLFFREPGKRSAHLLSFPSWETLPFENLSPYGPLVAERLSTLFQLTQWMGLSTVKGINAANRPGTVIFTTPMAMMQRQIPAQTLARHGFQVAEGDRLDLPEFRGFLTTAGYRAVSQVEEPGEFAVRGGIIDIFPPGREQPVRMDLFGDEVEILRLFDPVTQRSVERVRRFQALPVCETLFTETTISNFRTNYRAVFGGKAAEDERYRQVSENDKPQGIEQYLPLFYEKTDTFFDYLPENTVFLLEPEWQDAAVEREREFDERRAFIAENHPDHRLLPTQMFYLNMSELREKFDHCRLLEIVAEGGVDLGFIPSGQLYETPQQERFLVERVASGLKKAAAEDMRIAIAARTLSQRERLRETLNDHKVKCRDLELWRDLAFCDAGVVHLILGDLRGGFVHPGMQVVLLSEEEVFGFRIRRRQVDQRYLDQMMASFADLGEGDLVVHTDHGIGRYGGLHSLEFDGMRNDFLLIHYAEEQKLYVPVDALDRVSKYSGGEDVPLDKMGGTRWQKAKERARRKIMEMAEELVHLQAKREVAEGIAFSGMDPLYQEFAADFPYEETPDQAQAIEQVLADMAATRPMDRLVCGDVGFGKTEVALRASFRAAMDGKQVAVLTPTTILAQQHYETFSSRMAKYPIRVELLSRFRSPREVKAVVQAVNSGGVDIIIGTHRLLQADVSFKDLGLLVVDEEQRFGVIHKEKIKKMRATVDILTLTATPIPRTLNMAMARLRDISIIATPPSDRLAIRTIITHYDGHQVREAVLRELYRGGQVFYVYNKVQDIDKMAATLAELIPEAKVGVAHGQMRENQLEKVMISFYHQEFNLLVCTTIIENGVDIPTANTIIIHRADKFGLAQLHQLRGRVGRSRHRAYAYMLIPAEERLSPISRKRLDAIENLGDLGAGFMLATHDLEIRGAGNILGEDQSGEIREVGFELYNQMLSEAVAALNRHPNRFDTEQMEDAPPNINLNISTYLPENYVPDVHQRLTLYKRISGLTTPEEIAEMRSELLDRFGMLPTPVQNLLKVVETKRLCCHLRIKKLEVGPKGGSLQFYERPNINTESLISIIRDGGGAIRFNQENNTLSFRNRSWDDDERRLKEIGSVMQRLLGQMPM